MEFVDRHDVRPGAAVVGGTAGLGLGAAPAAVVVALKRQADGRVAGLGDADVGGGDAVRHAADADHGAFVGEELDQSVTVGEGQTVRGAVLDAGDVDDVVIPGAVAGGRRAGQGEGVVGRSAVAVVEHHGEGRGVAACGDAHFDELAHVG